MKKIISFFLAAALLMTSAAAFSGCKKRTDEGPTAEGGAEFEIYDLRTDDMVEPVGVDSASPAFSWKMSSETIGQKQTAYKIEVTDQVSGEKVWDSGKVESGDSVDIVYAGQALTPSTPYKWELSVFDKDGRELKTSSVFETGLMASKPFSDAKWISYADSSKPADTVYTIEFDFILEKGSTGFFFGASDTSNLLMWQYNVVEVAGDPLLFRPHIKSGGNWSVIKQLDLTGTLGMKGSEFVGRTFHQKIDVNGKTIKTYIGEAGGELTLIDTYTHSKEVKLGLIGFRHHADAQESGLYDNIVIKNGGGEILYSNDFSSGETGFIGSDKIEITSDGMLRASAPSGSGEQTALQQSGNGSVPAFRKSFTPAKEIKSAKLYTSGLGVYESYINGERVGKKLSDGSVEFHELKPGFTEMSDRKFYSSYDVTHMLSSGENVLSAVVTSGWWSGRVAASYGKEDAYIAKLILNYTDGSSETLTTGSDWKSARASAIKTADIFDGESYDSRVDLSWMKPGFNDSEWSAVKINNEFKGEITSWYGSYIKVRPELERTVKSVKIYEGATGATTAKYGVINVTAEYENGSFTLKPGQTALIDFGQNFAGWEAFTASGASGTVISVKHGEILNDKSGERSRGNDGPGGSIYNANYRSAAATTKYTMNGSGDETYHPSFTFYGFRYIEITVSAEVTFKSITGQVVTSVEKDTGFIDTSVEKLNQLFSNIRWGQYSNYLSVPTDCPQRDERQGWSADTQVFTTAGSFLAFSKSFLEKYTMDLRDSQNSQGAYPGTAPTGEYGGGDWGGTGWADAGVIIPYTLWLMYDDTSVISENWKAMQKYVDSYLGKTNKHGPRNVWGDWLAYQSNDQEIQDILAVAYYAWDALMMAEMAAAIGMDGEIEKYRGLYETEKEYFIQKYVKSDGSVKRGEQTVCLYALYLDLLPDQKSVEKVTDQLTKNIKSSGNKLQTGFLGTKIILDTLTKIGRTDLAYTLLLQEGNPSWLYSVDQGATTIWERWNSYTKESGFGDVGMNSFNHYAYGAVAGWMFNTMVGINYDKDNPGFKRIIVSPEPDARVCDVKASYDSAYGLIAVDSSFDGATWTYKLAIPANTSASVNIPMSSFTSLTVNGKALSDLTLENDGIRYVATENGVAQFEAVAASFTFVRT